MKMMVFGDAGSNRVSFSAYEAHVPHLATIVENRLLMEALWRRVQTQVGLTVFAGGAGHINKLGSGRRQPLTG